MSQSTVAPSGELGSNKPLTYEEPIAAFTKALDPLMKIASESYKMLLEQKQNAGTANGPTGGQPSVTKRETASDAEESTKVPEDKAPSFGSKVAEEDADEKDAEDEEKHLEAARRIRARRRARAEMSRKLEAKSDRLAAKRFISSGEEDAKKVEEAKKVDALKSRIEEVKKRVEEARTKREAKKKMEASGKGQLGEVKPENTQVSGLSAQQATPAYWTEILTASQRFKELGLLSG